MVVWVQVQVQRHVVVVGEGGELTVDAGGQGPVLLLHRLHPLLQLRHQLVGLQMLMLLLQLCQLLYNRFPLLLHYDPNRGHFGHQPLVDGSVAERDVHLNHHGHGVLQGFIYQ